MDKRDSHRIHPADRSPALDTLVAAFASDPGMRSRLVSPFDRSLRDFLGILLDICFEAGQVWAAPSWESVAAWTTPTGVDGGSLFAKHADRLAELTAGDAQLAATQAAFYDAHRPSSPAWFLCAVGTRPEARGQGWAKAVIIPGIKAADAEGTDAFLETDNPANVALYESLGFRSIAQKPLTDDLTSVSMIRPASGGSALQE